MARASETAPASEPGELLEAVLQERRDLREQLEAKRAELVAAVKAQQQLDKSCAEVVEERQAIFGEVRMLQHQNSEQEAAVREERRLREEDRRSLENAQLQLREAEQRQRAAERRLGEQTEALQAAEDKSRQLELRMQAAERAAKACNERATEAEQQCRVKAEKEATECKLKYAELGAARQKEMQAALLELQALARGQELLRAELSRALRPLPRAPLGSYLAPPLRSLPAAPVFRSPLRQAASEPMTGLRDLPSPCVARVVNTSEPMHRDLSPSRASSP
ncbi:unnamed protein product [Effrenium voratum]|nr:unnamed protein product [Effrenium voratum]